MRLRALKSDPFAFGAVYADWVNAPEERGDGAIDELISAASAWSRERATQLVLHVLETNNRAIGAYARNGFALQSTSVLGGDASVHGEIRMVKPLD